MIHREEQNTSKPQAHKKFLHKCPGSLAPKSTSRDNAPAFRMDVTLASTGKEEAVVILHFKDSSKI